MMTLRYREHRKHAFRLLCAAMALVALVVYETSVASAQHAITDTTGRLVVIDQPFKRVISLYGAHTENLYKMGAGKVLIGVGRSDHFPPAARMLPGFSYHDGPERFLAAAPDLVLIRPMIDRGYGPLIQRLEQSGIAVVSLQPGTIEEMYGYWRILGRLTGREQAADLMIDAFQKAILDFQALVKPLQHRKRVYFEAIHQRMKTFTPGSMPIFALETAGGINLASDANRVRTTNIAYYGKERILSRSAEIDVYLAQRGAMNQPTLEMIRSEPGFSVIKAVQENQIFIIDETIVARPTWRLLYGIDTIGKMLYPKHFHDHGGRILQQAEAALEAADTEESRPPET